MENLLLPRPDEHFWRRFYDQEDRSPLAWLGMAEALRQSAQLVWREVEQDVRATEAALELWRQGGPIPTLDASWLHVELTAVYQMLIGMAIEVLAKGVLRAMGKKPTTPTHNLRKLVKDIGLQGLKPPAWRMLDTLSRAITWHGRYPVPNKAEMMEPGPQPPLSEFPHGPDVIYDELKGLLVIEAKKAGTWPVLPDLKGNVPPR